MASFVFLAAGLAAAPGAGAVDETSPQQVMYMAFKSGVSLGGVSAADEDVLRWDGAAYSLVFDGSDVGLGALEIDGLDVLAADQLLISFTASGFVPGIGTVDDSDIVLFSGSLGPATSGTFSMYFDGSDVGLTRNGEDIDGLSLLDSGDLLISTKGGFKASGSSGGDEDVFRFSGSFGSDTAGSFSLHLDGSDLSLTAKSEDVDGLSDDGDGLYISSVGALSSAGAAGADEDVFHFAGSFGAQTSGSLTMFWDGSAEGTKVDMGALDIDTNPGDSRDCDDFTTQSQAQRWFDTYRPFFGDPARLDTNVNGIACDEPLPPSTTLPAIEDAIAAARAAEVVQVAPASPYDRDEYQPSGWPDSDGDCQNDRHEVLIEESLVEVTLDDSGCLVQTGRWIDPYDGRKYTRATEVHIDHVVALGHAHQVGSSAWDPTTKQAFGSDLAFAGSLVVSGAATNQSKGASSPAQWRPPLIAGWCSYGLDWVRVKQRWGLSYESEAERAAVLELLDTCTAEGMRPDQRTPVITAPVATSTTTTTTNTTVPQGDLTARLVSCSFRGETVVISNDGVSALNMRGHRLHDEGEKNLYSFPNLSIEPGATLTVATGPDATTDANRVVWKSQNVWNNDGDTATLIGPTGETTSLRCS
jgi:hypothetical protein